MRTILFVLALLGATVGRGQIVLDWYGSAPAAGLLLDDYGGAAAAYSLRLLNSAYTGNCIEVRRSNDNALQNIGFAGGVLDTAALKTFCGANDCFVRTWYDQSGNGRNMTQTTNANQPSIINGGNTITHLNRPMVQFNASTEILNTTAFSLSANRTYIMNIYNANNTATGFKMYLGAVAGGTDDLVNGIMGPFGISYVPTSYIGSGTANTRIGTGVMSNSSYFLLANYVQGSVQHQHYRNGALNAQNTSLTISPITTAQVQSIMATPSANDLWTSECIIYDSYQISNRTGIESNINSFYNIY